MRLTGTGADVFALPPGGGTSELTFTAQALAPGACAVKIVVKQGTVAVGNLTLKATAVGAQDAATVALDTTSGGRHGPDASTRPSSRGCRASRSTSAS